MNKVIALIVIICSAAWLNHSLNAELYAVQAGDLKLVCDMRDGRRVVDQDKVVDLIDGVWVFESGSAKSCEVIENVR